MIWNDHHLDDRVKDSPNLILNLIQGYVSSLRSARALPNDYWTAETVEDYMRCKVEEVFGRKSCHRNPVLTQPWIFRWSTSRLEFQTLWRGEEPSRPGFFQGARRRRWASFNPFTWVKKCCGPKLNKDVTWYSRRRTRRPCLSVNTTSQHRRWMEWNIKVPISKTESLTNLS